MIGRLVPILLLLLCVVGVGCRNRAGSVPGLASAPDPTLPSYEDVLAAHNERVERLRRIWARAVVSIDYITESGNRKYQQGDGHLQLVQPDRLALSVGKLGEVFLWIGSGPDLYWILETREAHRAFVGRHELATPEKTEDLGLPVPPLDLIKLLGVAPLPAEPPAGTRIRRAAEDDMVVVDVPQDGAVWRYWLDPRTLRPRIIELFESEPAGEAEITAWLDRYEQVELRGVGGIQPRMASLVQIIHRESDSRLKLTLEGMVDGGRGKLDPIVFELATLLETFGIESVRDLDQGSASLVAPARGP